MTTMRASYLIAPERSEVREVPVPEPKHDEILVQVAACGVCTSELHTWLGHNKAVKLPRLMGHEPSGTVAAVGSHVTRFKTGDRVAMLRYGGGGFAEYAVTLAEHAVRVPDAIPLDQAIMEPVACLVSAMERTPMPLAGRVAVVGCGFMGLGLIQMLAHSGAREVIAIDIDPHALDNARQAGADVCVLASDVPSEMKVLGPADAEQGLDTVIEVTGAQPGLTLAGELVRLHGFLSVVGYHANGLREIDLGLWNWKAFTMLNAHERRMGVLVDAIGKGLGLMEAGKIDMSALISHQFGLGQVDEAFQLMGSRPQGFIKSIVRPADDPIRVG